MPSVRNTPRAKTTDDRFHDRHIGPRRSDIETMLETLDLGSLDELVERALPASIRMKGELELEVSSAGAVPLVDLELARSTLEGGLGFSNTSWDEPVPDPTGPGFRQTLRATLATPPGSVGEAR